MSVPLPSASAVFQTSSAGGTLTFVAGVVHRSAVAVDVDRVAADDRRRLHLERQATHPPELPAGCHVVGREQKRSGYEDLILAVGSAPDDRRRVTALGFGPLDLPLHAAGALVHAHDERAKALVAGQDHQVAHDHRRGAHAVDVVERAERHRPALLPRAVVGDEAVVGEEHVDAVVLDRGARRRRVVALVDDLRLDLRRGTFPEDAALQPVDRDCHQRVAAKGCQVDPIVMKDGRRVPSRQRQPPEEVLLRPELDGNAGRRRNARAVRPAEPRPVRLSPGSDRYADRQTEEYWGENPNKN